MGRTSKSASAKADAKAEAKAEAKSAASNDRKDISNMLTQLKNHSATEDQKALLAYYQSLPRFSERKKEILAKWKADKTCSWQTMYHEFHIKSAESETKKAKGFGTVCIA
jgi:hypothetical protein